MLPLNIGIRHLNIFSYHAHITVSEYFLQREWIAAIQNVKQSACMPERMWRYPFVGAETRRISPFPKL